MAGDTHDKMEWIRDDFKYMRSAMDKFSSKLDQFGVSLDNQERCLASQERSLVSHEKNLLVHEKECPARKISGKLSIAPKGEMSTPAGYLWWLAKVAPIFLAAALGLLGIGAYLGGNQDVDKLEAKIQLLKTAIEKATNETRQNN